MSVVRDRYHLVHFYLNALQRLKIINMRENSDVYWAYWDLMDERINKHAK
jgi:hypothetical protein